MIGPGVTYGSDLLAESGDDGTVSCRLCYRLCELRSGEAGPCGHRVNQDGELALVGHGELSSFQRCISGLNGDTFASFKPGRPGVFLGGTRCTAACTFCSSGKAVHNPAGLDAAVPTGPLPPELEGLSTVPPLDMFHGQRAYMHPVVAARSAAELGARVATLGMNEPTLTLEWTLDFAAECARLGVDVVVQTNGFTTREGIELLAPLVSAVHVGIKGSADPRFYERVMRSPGGEVAALDSLKVWRDAGVHVVVGDLLAPPHLQPREDFERHAARFYERVYADLGEVVDVYTMIVLTPRPAGGVRMGEAGTPRRLWGEYIDREHMARWLAADAGLLFWRNGPRTMSCTCGTELIVNDDRCGDHLGEDAPCALGAVFCPFQKTTTPNVTADSRCASCGRAVPVVPTPPDDARAARTTITSTWDEWGPTWLASWQERTR